MAISLKESLIIGLSDFWSRKIRSLVTIIGIILGTMSIVVVLSIVNGVNKSTLSWLSERGGLNKIEVERNWSYESEGTGKEKFNLKEINFIHSRIPEAAAFNPQTQDFAKVYYNTEYNVGQVFGVMPDYVIAEEWNVQTGRFISSLDVLYNNDVVCIGDGLKSKLFGSKNPLNRYIRIRGHQLKVIGVMTKKYWKQPGGGMGGDNQLDYMNYMAFIPISTMIHKITGTDEISGFSVQASNPKDAEQLRQKIESIILNLRHGKPVFRVQSAQEQMQEMKKNTFIFSAIFFMIAFISLLVGGIVIMNIMLASIQERTREIGIRIAVGARRKDIFLQFLIQTVMTTAIGGVLGLGLGFSIIHLVGKYLNTQVGTSASMVYTALMVSVGVGLVFGIFPAIRASNLDPVEALRNE